MTITIELSAEAERRLSDKAARLKEDRTAVAASVLEEALAWEEQDFAEAVAGIQRGLDDFEAGRYRPFAGFADDQRRKYGLSSEK